MKVTRNGECISGQQPWKPVVKWGLQKSKEDAEEREEREHKRKNPEKDNIWDRARALDLTPKKIGFVDRYLGRGGIDPSCNYFILQLKELGMVTTFSCEGHLRSLHYDDKEKNFVPSSKVRMVIYVQDISKVLMDKIRNLGFKIEEDEMYRFKLLGKIYESEEDKEDWCRSVATLWEDRLGGVDLNKYKLLTDKTENNII